MKWIEEKSGSKTRMRLVQDDYEPGEKETPQKDLTTGGASLISMDISKEKYDRIFKTKEIRPKTAAQKKT